MTVRCSQVAATISGQATNGNLDQGVRDLLGFLDARRRPACLTDGGPEVAHDAAQAYLVDNSPRLGLAAARKIDLDAEVSRHPLQLCGAEGDRDELQGPAGGSNFSGAAEDASDSRNDRFTVHLD